MISITAKSTLRKKMLDTCIAKQQTIIDDFKTRINALLENAGLGNEEEYDNNEMSQKAQASEEVNSINEALNVANQEMTVLLNLKSANKAHTHVEPGAVVITNMNAFYISVSMDRFNIDGETYVGLSAKSPVYHAMKGFTKGHKFLNNGISYRINDIF
jgi:hypothetical protein